MNIVEATKKADSTHAIRRKSWVSNSMMLIPTDSTFLTSIVFRKDVINVRWNLVKVIYSPTIGKFALTL